MFRLYYAAAIDTCVEEAFKQIDDFKKIFFPYIKQFEFEGKLYPEKPVRHPIEVYGAGFNESPIIDPLKSSKVFKKVIVAYDLRIIRQCDIFLLVTNLKQFAVGSMMELEYARKLGLLTIVLCLTDSHVCYRCNGTKIDPDPVGNCLRCNGTGIKREIVKNIFLETLADKIIYSIDELEEILKEITK